MTSPPVATLSGVTVPMPDGISLSTDVYLPPNGGRSPVLLCRTPYGKAAVPRDPDIFGDVGVYLEAGYAVVVQDCRGTGTSEGSFRFLVDEEPDGVSTIRWCASQPWSDGSVGTFGGSYLSMAQYRAAHGGDIHHGAMSISVTPTLLYGDFLYRGGALCLAAAYDWARGRQDADAARSGHPPIDLATTDALAHIPLRDAPGLTGRFAEMYREWLEHPHLDGYWKRWREALSPRRSVPTMHLAGWYDVFLEGTIAGYRRALRARPSRPQTLVIGPWTHLGRTGRFPDRDFGPTAAASAIVPRLEVEFFDRALRGATTESAPVRIFTMGADVWRSFERWPPDDIRAQSLFLAAPEGEGVLQKSPSTDPGETRFEFDPR